MPKYIEKATVRGSFNPRAVLPHSLTIDNVRLTIEATHDLLYGMNSFLVSKGQPRLEEMMLGNAFAGFLSEIIVKNLADHSVQLTRNRKIGGYPDLIPKGKYPSDQVLRGQGLEVKASKQRGGWQGHNPEKGWLVVFVYRIDMETQPVEDRFPTQIDEVLSAELDDDDWSFSGRKGQSRRTITASILRKGVLRLRSNWIYSAQDRNERLEVG